jgi:hypothetical protein
MLHITEVLVVLIEIAEPVKYPGAVTPISGSGM